ncbi:MAG: hypothetical protein L3J35_02465 [Bacteroidales bacterium]|nr:hypothetical protein [Bacteroidales bacterium]
MTVKINYSKKSDKFLKKNQSVISQKEVSELVIFSLRRIILSEDINIDLKMMRGNYKGYYRIRKGNIRIVFQLEQNEIIIASVMTIGFRGDVY